ALLTAAGKPLGSERERRIEIALDGQTLRELVIPTDQADVLQQLDFTDAISRGSHRLTLRDRSDAATGYQVVNRHYVSPPPLPKKQEPLRTALASDRTTLSVDETVSATATVLNNMATTAPMVIVDLPIPPGFAMEAGDFERLATNGTIAKFQ